MGSGNTARGSEEAFLEVLLAGGCSGKVNLSLCFGDRIRSLAVEELGDRNLHAPLVED